MTKSVLNILFASLLLFQAVAIAEEETSPAETNNTTELKVEESEAPEETEVQPNGNREEKGTEGAKEALSEAQKEALAAEEAELREAGIYEESVEE